MYELRDYQEESVRAGLWYFAKYRKPFVIQAATGAGKSIIIAELCHRLNEPVLILQPSKELLEQNYAKLKSYGIDDIAIYSASKKSKEIGKYTYATIGSIYKKPELFMHFKHVIIDECHQVNPKKLDGMYTSFLRAIGTMNVCGLTATPYRIDQKFYMKGGERLYTATLKMINRIPPFFFKKIIYKIETAELINKGYLSPIKYFVQDVSLEKLKVNTTGADFTVESLEEFWDSDKLQSIANAIEHINRERKMSLTFCSSIRQAWDIREILQDMGLPSEVVTSKTLADDRERIVAAFKAGELRHILNVGIFTTGFDVPALDNVVLARPTMSLALYYQMVGRGVRKDPGDPSKVLHVYDFAGVVDRLGRVETIKLAKEEDGFRDMIVSEAGVMTNKPLFTFKVKRKMFGDKKQSTDNAQQGTTSQRKLL